MSESANPSRSTLELWEFAYSIFLRLLAVYFVISTIQVWMLAIGVSSDPQMRFDTMPFHWRMAVASLCVLHPMAALGLWGLFSWGIALWLINILVQLNMYIIFRPLFGFDQQVVIFHAVSFLIFTIFQLSLRFTNNKT